MLADTSVWHVCLCCVLCAVCCVLCVVCCVLCVVCCVLCVCVLCVVCCVLCVVCCVLCVVCCATHVDMCGWHKSLTQVFDMCGWHMLADTSVWHVCLWYLWLVTSSSEEHKSSSPQKSFSWQVFTLKYFRTLVQPLPLKVSFPRKKRRLKARTSLLPRFDEKRRSSFELWALSFRKCHPRWDWLYCVCGMGHVCVSHTCVCLTHMCVGDTCITCEGCVTYVCGTHRSACWCVPHTQHIWHMCYVCGMGYVCVSHTCVGHIGVHAYLTHVSRVWGGFCVMCVSHTHVCETHELYVCVIYT